MPDKTVIKHVALIMAGGSGERFWPLSRHNMPKQLLRLTRPDKTMLQEAIDRIAQRIPHEDIYIQTMPHLLETIKAAKLGIPDANVLAEPCKRNTAGCLCYAAAHLMAKHGDCCMAVLTADHAIGDETEFMNTVQNAFDAAEKQDALVTLGVKPTRPETGYGYIEVSDEILPGVYNVKNFKEKPTLASAEAYLKSGNFYWNSGMFFWRISVFLNEFDAASPKFSTVTRKMADHFKKNEIRQAEKLFESLDSISIDFALMENAKHVLMIPATFPWDDVGSLLSFDRSRKTDANGNVTEGVPILLNTTNCIVVNEGGPDNKAVGIIGMQDCIVIITQDAVLVAAKDQVENVRSIVQQLRDGNFPQI